MKLKSFELLAQLLEDNKINSTAVDHRETLLLNKKLICSTNKISPNNHIIRKKSLIKTLILEVIHFLIEVLLCILMRNLRMRQIK